MKKNATKAPAATPNLLARRVNFDDFLAKLGAKDRANLERHLAALEANPDHLNLWKRLVGALATLAPHAAQTVGQQSIQFFIADGKYRQQVFALEDLRDGRLVIYTVDALDKALDEGVLQRPGRNGGPENLYGVGARQGLSVEPVNSSNTPDPPAFYKHMLGWNRKALRILLTYDATPPQVAAAEQLCALAALAWQKALLEEKAV